MLNWLYFLESNKEYHKLLTFIDNEEDISGKSYLLFHGSVKCIDGRVFQSDNNLLISVNFFTHSLDVREKIVEHELNPTSLIDLYKIECKDCDPLTRGIDITSKATRIIWESELVKYLADRQFHFKDGSILTFPDSDFYRLLEQERQHSLK